MKYILLQDLPFLKADSVLGYGTWVGGGLGVDRGTTEYASGGSSHNGVRCFKDHENKLLESLFENKQWIRCLPETVGEALDLYDAKYFTRSEFIKFAERRGS